jgi:CysZ protein
MLLKRANIFLTYFHGIRMVWKGFAFIAKHKLGWFFLFPLVMSVLLWWMGYFAVGQMVDLIVGSLSPLLIFVDGWPQWAQWLFGTLGWLFLFVVRVGLFLLVAYLSGYVVLIFMAPVLSWMAAVTLRIQTGEDTPFTFQRFFADVWRGVVISVRNLVMQTLFYVLFLVAMFIPVVGWFAPAALFMSATYYYGFSFLDYGLEQHNVGYRQAVLFVQFNRGLAMGVGTLFSLCLSIPYVGIFLGGFLAIVSVVGATLAVTEELSRGNGIRNNKPLDVFKRMVQ